MKKLGTEGGFFKCTDDHIFEKTLKIELSPIPQAYTLKCSLYIGWTVPTFVAFVSFSSFSSASSPNDNSLKFLRKKSFLRQCDFIYFVQLIHHISITKNKFQFIWPNGFRGEEFKKSANQKQELPVAAMFINGLG